MRSVPVAKFLKDEYCEHISEFKRPLASASADGGYKIHSFKLFGNDVIREFLGERWLDPVVCMVLT